MIATAARQYDFQGRMFPSLSMIAREAKLIRHIFQRFVELGSSITLVKELKLDGVTSKASTPKCGFAPTASSVWCWNCAPSPSTKKRRQWHQR